MFTFMGDYRILFSLKNVTTGMKFMHLNTAVNNDYFLMIYIFLSNIHTKINYQTKKSITKIII